MVIIHVAVFWNVMLRDLIAICRSFELNISHHLQTGICFEISINIISTKVHATALNTDLNIIDEAV